MSSGQTALDEDEATVLHRWSARKIQPIVLLYVTAIFAGFMALSIFAFHSREAVKALAIGWIGAVAATVPGVIDKVEYRLTEAGLDKRAHHAKKPVPFKDVFRWDQLDRIVPTKHGFKYFKILNETSSLRRFWRMHISDQFSGEVHAEKSDLVRVLGIVERQRRVTASTG
jgi:hypothetical protein